MDNFNIVIHVTNANQFDETHSIFTSRGIVEKPNFLNGTEFTFNCKKCGKLVKLKFRRSNIENHKTLLCQDCMKIERYGSVSPFAREEVREKGMDKRIERYGAPYTLSKGSSLQQDVFSVIEERYGSKCSLKNKAVLQKSKDKNLKNLGVEFPLQSKKYQEITLANRMKNKQLTNECVDTSKSHQSYSGLGITQFDKFDDKGYAIHPNDEVGVTPFDLN